MSAVYSMKGVNVLLEVYEDKIAITPKGIMGLLNKGIIGSGTKEIPYTSIVAVKFKEAGVFNGHIQFIIPGGSESKGGIFATTKIANSMRSSDENTFMYAFDLLGKNNAMAREIKNYIDGALRKARSPQTSVPVTNLSDELQNLARLKEQGILSEEEFQAAKRKLIG